MISTIVFSVLAALCALSSGCVMTMRSLQRKFAHRAANATVPDPYAHYEKATYAYCYKIALGVMYACYLAGIIGVCVVGPTAVIAYWTMGIVSASVAAASIWDLFIDVRRS